MAGASASKRCSISITTRLSGDNYGNDFFTKAYFFVATPYGRIELGQQDGAAYKMAITGPVVAEEVAIDDTDIGFFRDPDDGRCAWRRISKVRSGVFATSNAAKISYYSPRLFGVQLGVSYTPELVKDVVPFADHAPHVADRQDNLIEGAINYTGFFGATSLGAYAGIAAGHNAQATPGHDDLLDWALGGEVDYDLGDVVLAAGGAYHQIERLRASTRRGLPHRHHPCRACHDQADDGRLADRL